MNGWRQVLGGSPGSFTPACGFGVGLGARSCSGIPDHRPHFSPQQAGAEPGPHPVAPRCAGRERESRELPLLQENRHSACVSTNVSII